MNYAVETSGKQWSVTMIVLVCLTRPESSPLSFCFTPYEREMRHTDDISDG